MVRSSLPPAETSVLLSGPNARAVIWSAWPASVNSSLPVAASHTRTVVVLRAGGDQLAVRADRGGRRPRGRGRSRGIASRLTSSHSFTALSTLAETMYAPVRAEGDRADPVLVAAEAVLLLGWRFCTSHSFTTWSAPRAGQVAAVLAPGDRRRPARCARVSVTADASAPSVPDLHLVVAAARRPAAGRRGCTPPRRRPAVCPVSVVSLPSASDPDLDRLVGAARGDALAVGRQVHRRHHRRGAP